MKKRPLGQPTRGKTALNRLRQVDIYILLAWSHLLKEDSPLIIDLGYGAYPWTALEMFARWRHLNSEMRLLGVEIDAERVANALPYAEPPVIDFKQGGFNLADIVPGKATVIRAYNVLRQYEESAVQEALQKMAHALITGGILIEGTSTPTGRLVAFDIYRKLVDGSLKHEELVFGTNFAEPINPTHFQAILPKRLIHHMLDETPARFFEAWRQSLNFARAKGVIKPQKQWVEAALQLKTMFNYPVDVRKRMIRRGFLCLRKLLQG